MENWREYINEDLSSSIFLKVRESAELDILSYFAMPSPEEVEAGMFQRQMPDSKRPLVWELRNYLLWSPEKRTSGFDLKEFRTNPVPEGPARRLADKVGLDYEQVLQSHKDKTHGGNKRWPLPGIDLTNYMIYWMVDAGTLTRFNDDTIAVTPAGAKRFHDMMSSAKQTLPDTIQGGEDAKFRPQKKSPGKKFDPSRFKK